MSDLAITNSSNEVQFLALDIDNEDFLEVINDNLAGQSLGVTDLQVTVPSGSSATAWSLPSPEGERFEKELKGVILAHNPNRRMYETPIDKGGMGLLPTCTSDNGVVGSLTQQQILEAYTRARRYMPDNAPPTRVLDSNLADRVKQECNGCPFAQFGTAPSGRGQYCNLRHTVYLLTTDSFLPLVVQIPAKSLKAARSYFLGLAQAGKTHLAVVTALGLRKDTANGVTYHQVTFKQIGVLDPEQKKKIKAYRDAMKPYLEQTGAELLTAVPVSSDELEYGGNLE